MQIDALQNAHTLTLFQNNGDLERRPAVYGGMTAASSAVRYTGGGYSSEMQGIYSPPLKAAHRSSGLLTERLDALRAVQSDELLSARRAASAEIEEAIGRSFADGETPSDLSAAERMTIPHDLRIASNRLERLNSLMLTATNDLDSWRSFGVPGATPRSNDEAIERAIDGYAGFRLGLVKMSSEFAVETFGETLSAKEKAALSPISDKDLAAMRSSMIEEVKADIVNGLYDIRFDDAGGVSLTRNG